MSNRKKQPLVSILLPTYNRERYIGRAIESVLNQTYRNFELIIIDDHSTDGTQKIIREFLNKDKRIKIVRNKKNRGIVYSLNTGLKIARGKYIAIMNDDDIIINREKTKKQVDFLEKNPEYVLVGGQVYDIDLYGNFLKKHTLPIHDEEIRKNFCLGSPICHAVMMFRKQVLDEAKKNYENYVLGSKSPCEDLDMKMFLGTKGKLHNLPEYFLARCRRRSVPKNRAKLALADRLRTMSKYAKEYHFRKIDYTLVVFNFVAGFLFNFLPNKSDVNKKVRNIYNIFQKDS